MDAELARRTLAAHWPGTLPVAQDTDGVCTVKLGSWPPAADRAERQAKSGHGFAAAIKDLATFTPPLVRCRNRDCVVCGTD